MTAGRPKRSEAELLQDRAKVQAQIFGANNSVFQFAGGSDPVLTAAGGSVDLLVFSVRASDKVDAVMVNDLK